jgi:hypothetical protein
MGAALRAPRTITMLACLAGLAAQPRLSMPAWLTVFPGASAQTETSPSQVESSYRTAAPAAEVTAHYAKLFEAAGLPFHPNWDGMGTSIRGSASECELLIQIRKQRAGTQVDVSCAARMAPAAAPAPRPADPAPPPRAEVKGYDGSVRNMEKFDQPYYPKRRMPMAPLRWPAWLVNCDGGSLDVQKGVDQFKLKFMKAEFTSQFERGEIQAYYAKLLTTHGYRIQMQSSPITPRGRKALVEGAYYVDEEPGSRFVIRADLTPVGESVHVELRITAHP